MSYSNWKDGEPNQMAGCGHMTTTGQWTMTPCDAKLEAAICQIIGKCMYNLTTIYSNLLHKYTNKQITRPHTCRVLLWIVYKHLIVNFLW